MYANCIKRILNITFLLIKNEYQINAINYFAIKYFVTQDRLKVD